MPKVSGATVVDCALTSVAKGGRAFSQYHRKVAVGEFENAYGASDGSGHHVAPGQHSSEQRRPSDAGGRWTHQSIRAHRERRPAGAGRETSGPLNNWAAISASPSRPQSIVSPQHQKAGTGGTCASTLQRVDQSPGCWTNIDLLCASPSETPYSDEKGLIVRTPEQRRRSVLP